MTTSLRQLHWLQATEQIDFKPAHLVYRCQHGAAPSYLADKLSQSADHLTPFTFCFITIRRCYQSATKPSRLPQLMFGTVCHSMLGLHHHRLSSTAAWRHTSWCAAFLDCNHRSYCSAWEVTLVMSESVHVHVNVASWFHRSHLDAEHVTRFHGFPWLADAYLYMLSLSLSLSVYVSLYLLLLLYIRNSSKSKAKKCKNQKRGYYFSIAWPSCPRASTSALPF